MLSDRVSGSSYEQSRMFFMNLPQSFPKAAAAASSVPAARNSGSTVLPSVQQPSARRRLGTVQPLRERRGEAVNIVRTQLTASALYDTEVLTFSEEVSIRRAGRFSVVSPRS